MGEVPPVQNSDPVGWADRIDVVAGSTSVTPVSFFLQNDSDPEMDPFWVTGVTSTEGHGTVRLLDGGTPLDTSDDQIEFVPAAGFTGETRFSYSIVDAYGGERPPTEVVVNVLPGNDPPNTPPVANADALMSYEDSHTQIPTAYLLSNDQDPDGDPLIVTAVGGATNGSVSLLPNGYVRFVPTSNLNETASFTYTISDGKGGTDTATVSLDYHPINDRPTLASVPDGTIQDQSNGAATSSGLSGQLVGADPEGDALTYALQGATTVGGNTVSKLTPYGELQLDTVTGTYVFIPNDGAINDLTAGQTVTESFTFEVSDGEMSDGYGGTATQDYSITLTGANDAPVAGADSFGGTGQAAIYEGSEAAIDIASLLLNDTDVDGDALSFAGIASGPGMGTLSVVTEESGSYLAYSYTGAPLAEGATTTDSFTYAVTDPDGATSTATVSLTVTGLANRTINGTNKAETLTGSDTASDTILAGNGDDLVFGKKGNDKLFGENGIDRLYGGEGWDVLDGGRGDDLLNGGLGNDTLTGNLGVDTFVFGETGSTANTGVDRITDFKAGTDDILLATGITVVSSSTSQLDDNDQLDTTLTLSNGGSVQVMDVSGLATDQWALLA